MPDSLIGKTLGQYQIVELAGRGGMATVYRAYQPSLRRYVALKVLPDHLAADQDFVVRFRQEALAGWQQVQAMRRTNRVACPRPGCEWEHNPIHAARLL
jgi:serine/threonine protein kinase